MDLSVNVNESVSCFNENANSKHTGDFVYAF